MTAGQMPSDHANVFSFAHRAYSLVDFDLFKTKTSSIAWLDLRSDFLFPRPELLSAAGWNGSWGLHWHLAWGRVKRVSLAASAGNDRRARRGRNLPPLPQQGRPATRGAGGGGRTTITKCLKRERAAFIFYYEYQGDFKFPGQ